MSVTLSKLSLRNARRQAQDYLIYFVTVVMAVALVYAFNGLVFSQELRTLSRVMESLPFMILFASVIVVCIIGWLVQYTTNFMLSRRSRELGTYILIGLENQQVARLFFLENLVVGGIALLFGILLGNLLFQALYAITLSLFGMSYHFGFSFSIQTIGLTLLYFTLVYLFALFRSRKRIRTMKICDFIHLDRQNETEILKKSRSRRKIFVISIVCGVIGTVLLMLRNAPCGILGACFIIVFLYGFFISFSSGVPAFFDKRPEQKYKGNCLLIFRTLSAKLATMGIVMATIALLFTATLISEGSGVVFHALFQNRSEQTTCFDLFIGAVVENDDYFDDYLSYIDTNIPVQESLQYHIYQGPNQKVTEYINSNIDYISDLDYDTLMKASDYTTLRAMLGYPEVSLKPNQYILHCMEYLQPLMSSYFEPLTIGNDTLTPGGMHTESFTQSLWDGNGRGFVLVVPDDVADSQPISHSIYAAMTTTPLNDENYNALSAIRDRKRETSPNFDTIFSKAQIESENAAMYAMIVFPLYYLALILTMVSATILTIHQLSECDRYRQQFELLSKLGMDRREMKQTLRRQFAIFYAMPAVPPLLIGIPFLLALCSALDPGVLTGLGHVLLILGVSFGLFFSIYFIYILLAYINLNRNVFPE